MENIEGLTLNTLLSVAQACGRYFSEAFILYVGAEVAAALDCAHTRTDNAGQPLGIVNRDINPARIRMGPHGEVRLTDAPSLPYRCRRPHDPPVHEARASSTHHVRAVLPCRADQRHTNARCRARFIDPHQCGRGRPRPTFEATTSLNVLEPSR